MTDITSLAASLYAAPAAPADPTADSLLTSSPAKPAAADPAPASGIGEPADKVQPVDRASLYAKPAPLPAPSAVEDREIAAVRSDDAKALNSNAAVVAQVLPDTLAESLAADGIEPDAARLAVANLRQWAADTALGPDDLAAIGAAVNRVNAADADPAALQAESVAAVRAEFGDGAERALAAARAFVAKQPQLAAFLEISGLGNHRAVVVPLARRALTLARAGRLTWT